MSLIDTFSKYASPFAHDGITHEVYWKKAGDPSEPSPAILVMHELPGMTESCLKFANRLVDNGFAVYLPLLFGKAGESSAITAILANSLINTSRICIGREFYALKQRQSSPITNWLRALCRQIYSQPEHHNFKGIGAIGMCLTGGFVLSVMIDKVVMAPVASQPSLPFGFTDSQKKALGISPMELVKAKERAKETGLLALRFEEDRICPAGRFETLNNEFGDSVQFKIISALERKRDGIRPSPHAIFTEDFADKLENPYPCTEEAFNQLIEFLRERLFN
jgi:dienelactone hydrolase